MARYIDLDKAIERLKASPAFSNMGTDGYFLLDIVENLLNKQPTADVVLREELELWKNERFNYYQRLECYGMTRQKVASEIFIDIRKRSIMWGGERHIHNAVFDELEKKYTEGGE